MEWRKTLAACLPTPLKRTIARLVCDAPPELPAPATPGKGLRVGLALAPGMAMEIVPGDIISDAIAATGIWEQDLSEKLVALARERGGLLVDVGANIGYFSLLWAAQGSACRVLAFEPSWRNFDLLRRNVVGNGLSERVDMVPLALGREHGIARFTLGPVEQTGWGGIVTDAQSGTVAVAVSPLDDLLSPDVEITVLKIDVEGADTWVLEGCRRLLECQRIARVFYEQNIPRMAALGIDPAAAATFLASVGYTARPITPRDHEVVEWEAFPAGNAV